MNRLLTLKSDLFPASEKLIYTLKVFGAKGTASIQVKKGTEGLEIRCHLLASLQLPPKKILDSEVVSKLGFSRGSSGGDQGLVLCLYTDHDYKLESRRTMELKDHGIETRFMKIEEERGYLEYPSALSTSQIVDPLSALYLARDKDFLKSAKDGTLHLLTKSGVSEVKMRMSGERVTSCPVLGATRDQVLLRFESSSPTVTKAKAYFENGLEVWIDRQTGVVAEISYPFFGTFGKASVVLTERLLVPGEAAALD